MNAIDRSFSAAELSRPSTPASTPALTAGAEPSRLRLTAGVARPSSASKVRAISLRSDLGGSGRQLAASRSTPALMAAAVGSLHGAAPLALPQRRAPPGAPCSDLQKA